MNHSATEKSEVLLLMIGTAIARKRCEKGWSQEYLAARIPITPAKLSRIECGKANARMTTLIRIGQALGVTVDELLGIKWSNRRNLRIFWPGSVLRNGTSF
mgnify:CR=1 FL=1